MFYLNLSIKILKGSSREFKVSDKWKQDLEKRLKAEENGYKVYTVWESDIKNSEEISKLKVLYYANR